jgi:hypothetical protein
VLVWSQPSLTEYSITRPRRSRRIRWIEQVRDVRTRFHVFSLSIHNDGVEVDDWYREWLDERWRPARMLFAAEQAHGHEVLRELYTAIGNRIHLGKARIDRDLYVTALKDVGLPIELVDTAESTMFHEGLLASNEAALAPVNDNLGVPCFHIPGENGEVNAFFGPVASPTPGVRRPTGECGYHIDAGSTTNRRSTASWNFRTASI